MADAKADGGGTGQFKRFSGENLDGKELKKWKLWAQAKMAATKDLTGKQKGPWVFTLLDGLALETVEHLTLEQLVEENGDSHIWTALEERFPDKLKHDHLAEYLSEVFNLAAREGENMAAWCSRVQESFAKCRRKVNVDFPSEARGWVALHQSGLSHDQRAVVTARAGGELKFDTIASSLRSCFAEFQVPARAKKPTSAYLAQSQETEAPDEQVDSGDGVIFTEVEALLAEYGVHDIEDTEGETFEESEAIEILAATWKEKRSEISRLQKSRNFRQVSQVQRQFKQDVPDVKRRARCWRCQQVGHFSRDCPKPKGQGKGSSSGTTSERSAPVSGAAMVEDRTSVDVGVSSSEVFLVSSPGFGIIDSGCGKTLIGQSTLNSLFRMLAEADQPIPSLRPEQHVFRFGNQHEEVSKCTVTLPIGINGKLGMVDASVIKGTAPLLLSRNTMKSLGAILDFQKETLSLAGGKPQSLVVNEAGQYVISIMDFPSKSRMMKGDKQFQLGTGDSKVLSRKEARCIESLAASWQKGKSTCVVAELFSPPRFAQEAERQGLRGLSFDIKNGFDLFKPQVQREVDQLLDEERPELLVLCPECKHWGGWYRLNEHKLPTWKRVWNRRIAEKQVDFCIAQAKKQLKRGGRVIFEHPWPSSVWRYPPMLKLLNTMFLCKTNMCAYGLVNPDTGLPIQKATGLAVSHADMVDMVKTCPGHETHHVIAGKLESGQSVSEYTAAYTRKFCQHWLSCIHSPCHLCEPTDIQDAFSTFNSSEMLSAGLTEVLAAEQASPEQIHSSLKKLHANLGHPSNTDLVRVLTNAGGSKEAIAAARTFHCEVCVQRQRPTPVIPASAHQILDFGHRVGIDVKILPGWRTNQRVKCLNIVDYGSSFQMMCPFYEVETGKLIQELFQEKWVSWAGRPVEILLDPAQTNMSEAFTGAQEMAGVRVLSIAAEAHNQLGKVEKHGHLFETVLQKVLDSIQPTSKEEYHQCIRATANSKNEGLNHQGLSPCQHVFGRNPRVPEDLVQDQPCVVAATAPLHSELHARSQAIRTAARISLAQAHDSKALRVALNARPRAERDFLPGDFVAYWRTQKYEKGTRLVGGRWYGTAIVMGKVGRNLLAYHRRNMFKVSPEHLRHATLEERAVAQSDGREMLGIAKFVDEQGTLRGSHYVDLTNQDCPPGPDDGQGVQEVSIDAQPEASAAPASSSVSASLPAAPMHVDAPEEGRESELVSQESSSQAVEENPKAAVRSEPFSESRRTSDVSQGPTYGPLRIRHTSKKPEVLVRPPAALPSDFMEAHHEVASHKRQHTRDLSSEPPHKAGKTEGAGDEALFAQPSGTDMNEVFLVTEQEGESAEVFVANFLKKKMQSELHHSNNPSELQESIDQAKVIEWLTLQDEKQALVAIPPHQAGKVRKHQPDRIMSSRFVITEKSEDGDTKIKARLCLRGHHDPDLVQKVLSGKCHSPTLSQFSRNILLQLIVSHRWTMKLGDIKGAFLEADVKEQLMANPVFAELPPGGVPGVEKGSLIQVTGNIYGANDAPHNWYVEFDTEAQHAGFTRSKFDSCLYFCYGASGKLEGVLGAHVDDTITGGAGERYDQAISQLRARFPFRKWREGQGEFLGVVYTQCPSTKEITFCQEEYAKHIQPIRISRERCRMPWKAATAQEIASLRAVNGALGWLSSQSRPDLSVQTSMSQQVFPNPTVQDLLQANQAVRRARQHADMTMRVPYIPPDKLTVVFWSDAAFANHVDHRTQGGWLLGLTSKDMSSGVDVPLSCIGWKSYRLPRVVSSTLGGESQSYASASGVAEWCLLILAEALDSPFSLRAIDEVLTRRSPIGITDCRSLYDHLISLGSGGVLDDRRTAIDIAIIRQSIARTKLEPRWCPTDRMAADGLTKDRAEPIDLLRSILRNSKYQLADEQAMSNSKDFKPVTADELTQVKNILERMHSQGLSPGNSALDALTAFNQSPLRSSSMTDASKRQRDESSACGPRPSGLEAEISESEFDVVSSPGASTTRTSQSPYAPVKKMPEAEIELPPGVKDVQQWGETICELQRVKSENKTYHEIANDPALQSYVTWIVQHGKGKSARCDDFRNFLIFAKHAQGRDHGMTFPGSNEIRRFRGA
eukprot:s2219_g4.t1